MNARERWDTRHMAADETDPPPSEVLVELVDLLPRSGVALDLACGRGRNAVWLAQRGLDVDAVDISSIALAKAMSLAARRGVADRVKPIEHDLDAGLPRLRDRYDVVVCLHFRQPKLWPALAPLVAQGGVLIVEVLARDPANLDVNPEFLGERDELLAAARGLEIEFHGRTSVGKRAADRIVARRPKH